MGLIRKIAQCEKTEYSAKLVELVQGILGLLNEKELDAMQRDELSLLQMCIGVLADMVDITTGGVRLLNTRTRICVVC